MKDLEDFDGRFMNNGINGLFDDKFQDQKMLLIRKFFIDTLNKRDHEFKNLISEEINSAVMAKENTSRLASLFIKINK